MIFGCRLTDADLVRACAPEQPAVIAVGQRWMRAEDGTELPVKRVRPEYVALGGISLTIVLSHASLRAEWVCIDSPENVREIRPTAEEGE